VRSSTEFAAVRGNVGPERIAVTRDLVVRGPVLKIRDGPVGRRSRLCGVALLSDGGVLEAFCPRRVAEEPATAGRFLIADAGDRNVGDGTRGRIGRVGFGLTRAEGAEQYDDDAGRQATAKRVQEHDDLG